MINLDNDIKDFLKEIASGQSLNLAAWATKILDHNSITEKELEKLFQLGF